jgi:hypothetical protein
MLESVLDMLRDPDKKGQHEVMGCNGLFSIDRLEIGSAVNYLSAAANSKRETIIPEGGITLNA